MSREEVSPIPLYVGYTVLLAGTVFLYLWYQTDVFDQYKVDDGSSCPHPMWRLVRHQGIVRKQCMSCGAIL